MNKVLKNFSYQEVNPHYNLFLEREPLKQNKKIITVILINDKNPLSLQQIKHYSKKLAIENFKPLPPPTKIIIKFTIIDCQGEFKEPKKLKEILTINRNIHLVFFNKKKQQSKINNNLMPLLNYLLLKNNSDYFWILSSVFFIEKIKPLKLIDYYNSQCDILVPVSDNLEGTRVSFSYHLIKQNKKYSLQECTKGHFNNYLTYPYFPKEINFFISKENYTSLQGLDLTYQNPIFSVYDLFLRALFRNQKIVIKDVFSCLLTTNNRKQELINTLDILNKELSTLFYKNTSQLWKKNNNRWFENLKLFFLFQKLRKKNIRRQLIAENEIWNLLL